MLVQRTSSALWPSDMADAVAPADRRAQAVSTWLARLRRWQRLLAAPSPDGPERGAPARPLRGALVAPTSPAPGLGPDAAVEAWTGPTPPPMISSLPRAPSRSSRPPGSSTRSCESPASGSSTTPESPASSSSICRWMFARATARRCRTPSAALRDTLTGTAAATAFEERLLAVRLLRRPRAAVSSHRLHASRGVTSSTWPRISRDLTEADLPLGVGDVRYSVAVAECKHWGVRADEVMATLPEARPMTRPTTS